MSPLNVEFLTNVKFTFNIVTYYKGITQWFFKKFAQPKT